MQSYLNVVVLLPLLILFNGCGDEFENLYTEKSVITPAFEPIVIDNSFLKEPVVLDLDPIEVDRPFNLFSAIPIPIISDLADTIANTFLDIFTIFSNGIPVNTDEDVAYFEIGEFDKEVLHGVRMVRFELYYEAKPRKNWEKVQFWNNFKDDLTFFKDVVINVATQEQLDRNPNFAGIPIAFHDPQNPKWCDRKKKCLSMQIPAVNLVDYLDGPTKIYIIPRIEVGKTPANFILNGRVEVAIDTSLGF